MKIKYRSDLNFYFIEFFYSEFADAKVEFRTIPISESTPQMPAYNGEFGFINYMMRKLNNQFYLTLLVSKIV
ncbi:MAG: hypothetical protein ACI7YS_07820 [Flavobacterium sp.]